MGVWGPGGELGTRNAPREPRSGLGYRERRIGVQHLVEEYVERDYVVALAVDMAQVMPCLSLGLSPYDIA